MMHNQTIWNRSSILGLLILAGFASANAYAKDNITLPQTVTGSETVANATKASHEKIGVVLSGGGARGLAHLGVLKALEAQHVPIDYIAGTSAGALIGGMYASGMSIAQIESKIKDLDLTAVAFAPPNRKELPQTTRNLDYKGNVIVDVSVTEEGKVALPAAVSNGAKVEQVLRDILKDHPYNTDFDTLPIPFRAVAADLATGKMVVLKEGQLANALRASMSIPAAFTPVEIDGKLLVDGMIDRNLPVDVVKRMGATRIIAVDVSSGLLPKDQLNSVIGVSEQMLNLLVKRNMDEQIALLTPKDVYIKPALGDIGSLEFQRGAEAAKIGFEAAEAPSIQQQLAHLSVPSATYATLMAKHAPQKAPNIKIDFIRVQTNGLASPATLRAEISMKEGQNFDINAVNKDINSLMSSGRIGSVGYAIEKVGNYNELVYKVEEKDVAKNAIRAGVEVASNGLSDQQFTLHLSHRRVWLNSFGGEWRNHLTFGKTTSVDTQLNQPLSHSGSAYIRPYMHASYEKHPAYLTNSDNIGAEYTSNRQTYGFWAGAPIGRIGEWGVGLSYRRAHLYSNTVNPLLNISSSTFSHTTLDAQVTLDQLDDAYIPTKGYFLRAFAHVSPSTSQNERRHMQAGFIGLYAMNKKAHSLAFTLEAAGQSNTGNVYLSPFTLGGYQHLSGYAQDQFVGNYRAFSSLTYRYRTPLSILNNPLIVGASLEVGNTWEHASDISTRFLKYSGSIFGALRTPIGPAQLGIGLTRSGNARLYFFLGKTFTETP